MALATTHGEQEFKVGDTVRVYQKIQEEEVAKAGPTKADSGPKGKLEKRVRTQVFQGTVIAIKGKGQNKMFTVRRLGAGGVGVERIFPLHSPAVEKVEVVAPGYVRRAKLYYLRQKPARELAELTKKYARKKQAEKSAALQKKRKVTRKPATRKARKGPRRTQKKK